MDDLQNLISSRQAEIRFSKLPHLLCNESQMLIFFQNLIENGIKYNKSKIPRIDISYIDQQLEHETKIADYGIGIEEKYVDKVFEMLYRLHNQEEFFRDWYRSGNL